MTLKTSAEAELTWTKSSYSSNEGPNCVEAAALPRTILIRDSKRPTGPRLGFTATAWAAFVSHTARG